MTFDRSPVPPGEIGPVHAPTAGQARGDAAAGATNLAPTPVQLRLQILTTEHWSLLASRGLAWNESFARAGMYLSTLAGAMVALGLVAGVDRLGDIFVAVALVILPVVLFVGVATFLRMGAINYHDAITVHGMNRIRGAYLEIAPELEPYFVMGVHDDPAGIRITMGIPAAVPGVVHRISATPFVVSVLNGVVAGAIAAIVVLRVAGLAPLPCVAVGAVAFLVTLLAHNRQANSWIRSGQAGLRPMFPTPGVAESGLFASAAPPADAPAPRADAPARSTTRAEPGREP